MEAPSTQGQVAVSRLISCPHDHATAMAAHNASVQSLHRSVGLVGTAAAQPVVTGAARRVTRSQDYTMELPSTASTLMRSRMVQIGRVRGQAHLARSSARTSSLENEDSREGPNTRSRKRRSSSEHSSEVEQNPALQVPRKRARAKHSSLKKPPPPQLEAADDGDKKPSPSDTCCICMCDVVPEDLAGINGCEHRFCFGCIEKWAERENSCPLCKNRFSKIDRVNKKRKRGTKNSKKVKQRDQRSDLVPGAALEGLLGRLIEESRSRVPGRTNDLTEFFSAANFASRHPNPPNIARLIFSGVGSFDLNSLPGPTARFTRSNARSAVGLSDEPQFSSDDEESPLSNFIRAFHSHTGVMQVVRPISLTTHLASRSYASNSNDRNAGSGAENPLEIDDDSDDDTVEVVQVTRPA